MYQWAHTVTKSYMFLADHHCHLACPEICQSVQICVLIKPTGLCRTSNAQKKIRTRPTYFDPPTVPKIWNFGVVGEGGQNMAEGSGKNFVRLWQHQKLRKHMDLFT